MAGERAPGERISRAVPPPDERALDHGDLVARGRVVDHQLEHEAVDLRLGQRVGALGLDRVLRGEHEERRRDRMGLVADRHLPLLHDLEQRGLHLRRRAVDLVREQEVAEHGAELGVEAARVRPVDPRADQVGRHEVGRELQALERAAEHVGDGLDGERLGEAGHALEQHVPAGEERHEQPLEHPFLADDHALDLEERGLERGVRLARRVVLAALDGAQRGFVGAHGRVGLPGRVRDGAHAGQPCWSWSGRVPSVTSIVVCWPLRSTVRAHAGRPA